MVTSEHSAKAFDEELGELRSLLRDMGVLVTEQVELSLNALERGDQHSVEKLTRKDSIVDALYSQIEEKAALIVAKRQPVAGDLRAIVSSIRIASDLERVGDLAKNTAMRGASISEPSKQLSEIILPLGAQALEVLHNVLRAANERDADTALSVWNNDGELDARYNQAFQLLLNHMLKDPWSIGVCTHLQFVAKNFERIGDHATNIAESVCYLVDGRMPAGPRPKN